MRAATIARRVASFVVPYGIGVALRERRQRRRTESVWLAARARADGRVPPFEYEAAVAMLVARGIPEAAVRLGSIPVGPVNFVRDVLARELGGGAPLRVLHIGNFVGVSLAGVSSAARDLHEESLTVSVDPNVPHLGVTDTQDATVGLLTQLGLERHNLLICGYTLEKTVSSDGLAVGGYDPVARSGEETAFENVLPHLEALGARFDAAVLDGSHLGPYAERELAAVVRLVRPGGLVFLDDASDDWVEVRDLFAAASTDETIPLERVDHDGRMGVLRRTEG